MHETSKNSFSPSLSVACLIVMLYSYIVVLMIVFFCEAIYTHTIGKVICDH
eukprot:UN24776